MSNATNTASVKKNKKVTEYTFDLNQFNVNDLQTEADMLQALNEYRRENGLSTARNAYSWWKYILTAIAFSKNSITIAEACDLVETRLNVKINRSVIGQLVKAINGNAPDKVRREYTNGLPFIVKAIGLRYSKNTTSTRGRPSYKFTFNDRERARKLLFSITPETKLLYETLRKLDPGVDNIH